MTTIFNQELSKRNDISRSKPYIKLRQKQLYASIDSSLTYVKGYTKVTTSNYTSFGIEYRTNKHAFPRDRNKRSAYLQLTVATVDAKAVDEIEFGTDF